MSFSFFCLFTIAPCSPDSPPFHGMILSTPIAMSSSTQPKMTPACPYIFGADPPSRRLNVVSPRPSAPNGSFQLYAPPPRDSAATLFRAWFGRLRRADLPPPFLQKRVVVRHLLLKAGASHRGSVFRHPLVPPIGDNEGQFQFRHPLGVGDNKWRVVKGCKTRINGR
jgi:hypothetical protein